MESSPHRGPKSMAAAKRCRFAGFACSLAITLLLSTEARAGFIDAYPFSRFTLINTDADGDAAATLGGLPFVITGGNTGSGLSGSTDFVTTALGSGPVLFDFSFQTADDPGFDSAGFLLRGLYYELANTGGVVGAGEFSVAAGDLFGWRVFTLDNQFEPGVLTVDNVSAPVPEPSLLFVVLAAIAVAAAARQRLIGHSRSRETSQ